MSASRYALCAAVSLMFVSLEGPACAGVLRVDASATGTPVDGSSFTRAFRTIQSAVDAASPGDALWVVRGNYHEHLVVPIGLSLLGGFAGIETQAEQRDPVINVTVVDADLSGTALTIAAGMSDVVIDGLTFQRGKGTGGSRQFVRGGGILAESAAHFTVTRCTFRDNDIRSADETRGGAIYFRAFNPGPRATITDNVFTGNKAHAGGAVYLIGSNTVLRRNTFSENSAIIGGALYLTGSGGWMVADNVLTKNSADLGGAIAMATAYDGRVLHNVFANNVAYEGGAISIGPSPGASVSGNIFRNNIALTDAVGARGAGGAIYAYGGQEMLVASNLLVNNRALRADNSGALGGGIAADAQTVVNNTIVGSVGGAIYAAGPGLIANNILAFNDVGLTQAPDTVAGYRSHNDAFGNTQGNYIGTNDPTGLSGNLSLDPLFADQANGDYHLLESSPLVDKGDVSVVDPGAEDVEGNDRFRGLAVDMGAFEFQSPVLPFTVYDVIYSMRIVGGHVSARSYHLIRLNVTEPDATGITLSDAAQLARKVAGLEPNP